MNQDKIHLINKIFNNETIRTVWDKEDEKYYIFFDEIQNALEWEKVVNSLRATKNTSIL